MAIHFADGQSNCPIKLSPPSVVVRYGQPVTINCSTLTDQSYGIGWEATEGGTGLREVSHLTWTVERLTDWTASPSCYMSPRPDSPLEQCTSQPRVVLYSEFYFYHPTEQKHMPGVLMSALSCSLPRLHFHQLQHHS